MKSKSKIQGYICKLVPFCLLILIANNFVTGELLVNQSSIGVPNVPVGKKYELKTSKNFFLSIDNRNTKPADYVISIVSCKEYGSSPNVGYVDIPETSWIEIKQPEISVPAEKTEYLRDVFIKIPKNKKYYNQHWQAFVKVLQKPSAGATINLEVVLPLWIETVRVPKNK